MMQLCDRLPITEKSVVELDKRESYMKILSPNKAPGPYRIKAEIYEGSSNITASDINNKGLLPNCFHISNISI